MVSNDVGEVVKVHHVAILFITIFHVVIGHEESVRIQFFINVRNFWGSNLITLVF
jgi:hypothetical protein